MGFVQPLSIIQSFIDLLVVTHDVVRSSSSSYLSSTIWTSIENFGICIPFPHVPIDRICDIDIWPPPTLVGLMTFLLAIVQSQLKVRIVRLSIVNSIKV